MTDISEEIRSGKRYITGCKKVEIRRGACKVCGHDLYFNEHVEEWQCLHCLPDVTEVLDALWYPSEDEIIEMVLKHVNLTSRECYCRQCGISVNSANTPPEFHLWEVHDVRFVNGPRYHPETGEKAPWFHTAVYCPECESKAWGDKCEKCGADCRVLPKAQRGELLSNWQKKKH
jgi:hypothetical protein